MTNPSTFSVPLENSVDSKVRLVIAGKPIAMARPRFARGRAYLQENMRDTKTSLAWQMAMGWSRPKIPRDQAVCLEIEFVFKALKKKDIGTYRPRKPDLDNLTKMVMDAANGILYHDDAQVTESRVSKRWGEADETRITVSRCP